MQTHLLESSSILPVVVINHARDAVPLAKALLAGGLKAVEVTFRTEAAADAIVAIRAELPEMIVSAGTVVTPEQAQRALAAGAQFGLAPGFDAEVVSIFQEADRPFVPGVMTPTDVQNALKAGCSHVKFFPAEAVGGTTLLKSLIAPFKATGIKFCPTGGLKPSNMKEYLSIAQVFAIGGTWLAKPEQIEAQDWHTISQQVKEALALAT